MPISEKQLKAYADNDVFVETGTWNGGGVNVAIACGFPLIYSIEQSEKLFNKAIGKFKDNDNIEIIKGDSAEQLPLLLQRIDCRMTFWLDAHTPECPLLEELAAIREHPIKVHTILIDDRRIFDGKGIDVKEVDVMAAIMKINPDYKVDYLPTRKNPTDIIVAHI